MCSNANAVKSAWDGWFISYFFFQNHWNLSGKQVIVTCLLF